MQLPVWCGYETAVLPVAAAYHGERRSLHPSDRVVGRAGDDGQGTAGVHAHQPVRLRAAVGGGIQAVVFRAVLQFLQPFPYGLVSKRGNPQASEWFRAAQKVVYPAEDKFPFRPASVATMMLSQRLNTLSMTFSCFEAAMSVTIPPVRAYLPGDQAERVRQHRQVLRRCFRVTVSVRHGQ